MPSIIFVHGTGVREESYNESLAQVRAGAEPFNASVVPCFWGKTHGVVEKEKWASIPRFESTLRDAKEPTEKERRLATWAAIYRDPLYELRLLEIQNQSQASGQFNPAMLGRKSVYEQLAPRVTKLKEDATLKVDLIRCRLDGVWGQVVDDFLTRPEFNALRAAYDDSTEIRLVIARALIAGGLRRKHEDPDSIVLSGRDRDRLEESVLAALGGRTMAAGKWLLNDVLLPLFTSSVQGRRGDLSAKGLGFTGDILMYQTRGGPIREFIHEQIERTWKEKGAPVVLLAHSLGGIACVDLLIERDLKTKVAALITVGSQAPFLYEMNALSSRTFPEPLPAHFPSRWLNVYDECDFLSYLAEGVFPNAGDSDIRDIKVDNGQPFPQAHGAYWLNPEFWKEIGEVLR